MRALRFLVPLVLVTAPACSLLVRSDDLLGGAAPAADAGAEGADGGASAPDGTATAADGAPSGGACALCDDFEGSSKVVWRTSKTTGATITVDGVSPKSGQKSLHASRPLGSGRDKASFTAAFPGTVRSCELDVLASATGASTAMSFFLFGYDKLPAPYTTYQVSLGIGGGAAEFQAGGSSPPYHDKAIPELSAFGRWVHVRIDFTFAQSSSVDVSVDGTKVLTGFAIAPPAGASGPTIEIGAVYQSNVDAGWDVFVDNVVCTTP